MLSAERLRALLDYDACTGVFRWREKPSKRIRKRAVAGALSSDGHRRIVIDGHRYQAHHLAWLWMTGATPPAKLDHANGVPDDNRFQNLRPATTRQNAQNMRRPETNTSGFKGVSWCAQTKKWRSKITVDGKFVHLGRFDCPVEAHRAYLAAADRFFGEFARAG